MENQEKYHPALLNPLQNYSLKNNRFFYRLLQKFIQTFTDIGHFCNTDIFKSFK
jgi:hypothetical protein